MSYYRKLVHGTAESKIRSDKSKAGVVAAVIVILALLMFACGQIIQSSQPQRPPVSKGR